VWDGVYSDEQARRGESQYGRFCESCHGADLAGNQVDEVPALTWDAFLMQWNDRTVKDLFDSIKRAMPRDNPGSLNQRAYVDVIGLARTDRDRKNQAVGTFTTEDAEDTEVQP
jgi:hypothetical protein